MFEVVYRLTRASCLLFGTWDLVQLAQRPLSGINNMCLSITLRQEMDTLLWVLGSCV